MRRAAQRPLRIRSMGDESRRPLRTVEQEGVRLGLLGVTDRHDADPLFRIDAGGDLVPELGRRIRLGRTPLGGVEFGRQLGGRRTDLRHRAEIKRRDDEFL